MAIILGRRSVSYCDHQGRPNALMDPGLFMKEDAKRDISNIERAGFNDVVVCVSELDLMTKARQKFLADFVEESKKQGLTVTADPWRLGGAFGGEGFSAFEQNGEEASLSNPKFVKLTEDWLQLIVDAGVKNVFWDEPSVGSNGEDQSLEYLSRFTERAKQLGVEHNGVCVRWRDASAESANAVAALEAVDEVAVAPYVFHPGSTTPRSPDEVAGYVTPKFEAISQAAANHGVTAQAWVQNFNLDKRTLPTMQTYVDCIRRAGISNVATWTYDGASSYPFLNPGASQPRQSWRESIRLVGNYPLDRALAAVNQGS